MSNVHRLSYGQFSVPVRELRSGPIFRTIPGKLLSVFDVDVGMFKVRSSTRVFALAFNLQPWHVRGCLSVNDSIFQCSKVQSHYYSGAVIQAHLLDQLKRTRPNLLPRQMRLKLQLRSPRRFDDSVAFKTAYHCLDPWYGPTEELVGFYLSRYWASEL
jgi:hypothetical protein